MTMPALRDLLTAECPRRASRSVLTGCEFQAPQKCLRLTSVYAINFMP